ncbi:MAG: hypothetical protein H7Y59_13235 [Anaerolineales bacterium]|nr:hypothetical protein [Anaerolineales bacterium]
MMRTIKTEIINWLQSKRRAINLFIGLSAVVIYEVMRAYYRPFIYTNGINDFYIADTLGNSLGTIATVFVFVSVLGTDHAKDIFLIRTVTIAVIVYELAHPLLGKTIDPLDIIATVVAGIFSEILYRVIHRS